MQTLTTSVEYTHMISNLSSLSTTASDAERRGKFPPLTIWRYVLREHAGPFLFAFVVIFFILVIDLLVDIMDAILGKGLAASTVLELFILNFAWMIALAVPMAVLVSVLMAFGRMANDNEMIALMAAGMSPISLVMPVLLAGGVLAGGLIWFNNAILPDSNYRARVLMANVQRRKPAVNLVDREGMFITDFPSHVLRVDRVVLESSSPNGPLTGSRLEGIVVYEYDEGAQDPATVITAETGTIELWRGGAVIRLTLYDGEMIQLDANDRSRDLQTKFDTQTIIMTDRRRDPNVESWTASGHRNDRELSATAMYERVEMYRRQIAESASRADGFSADTSMTAHDIERRRDAESRLQENYESYISRYMVEIHKKYSIPIACIVFVLVGTPLGMMARGAGRTAAVGVSLVLFLLYWASLIGGEQLADREVVSPFLAMWGANIIVGICGVVLLAAVTNNVRIASLMEALPRALEARRLRKARQQAEDTVQPVS